MDLLIFWVASPSPPAPGNPVPKLVSRAAPGTAADAMAPLVHSQTSCTPRNLEEAPGLHLSPKFGRSFPIKTLWTHAALVMSCSSARCQVTVAHAVRKWLHPQTDPADTMSLEQNPKTITCTTPDSGLFTSAEERL